MNTETIADSTDSWCTQKDPNDPSWNFTDQLNMTTFQNESWQLPSYACAYYGALRTVRETTLAGGGLKAAGSILGLFSSIAALIVFSQKEFRTVSFFYHLVINVVDLLNSLMFLEDSLTYILGADFYRRYATWVYARAYFLEAANEIALGWINLLIVWVAIERCIATMLPRHFHMINKKTVATTVVISTLLVTVATFIPGAFKSYPYYSPSRGRYVIKYSHFHTHGYETYIQILSASRFLVAACMVLATSGTIMGLRKMSKRKKTLAVPDGRRPSDDLSKKELWKQCSLNSQLCVLQLCEAVPVIAHEILVAVYDGILRIGSSEALKSEPLKRGYEEAMNEIKVYQIARYLFVVVRLCSVLSHCCHFYWYVIFCPRVRRQVAIMVKRKAVEPQATEFHSRFERKAL